MSLDIVIRALDATNNNDNNIRKEAEKALNSLMNEQGFFPSLLTVLSNNDIPNRIKLNAAIALKNRLRNHYEESDSDSDIFVVCDADKVILRQNFVPVMCSQKEECVISLMGVALEEIAAADLPEKWQECIGQIEMAMSSGNDSSFYNAVFVIRSILHCFQYRKNKETVHAITQHFYPVILQWVKQFMINKPTDERLKMCNLIVKMYYTGIDVTSEKVSFFVINDFATWQLLSMPVFNADNNLESVSAEEKALFPEWHVKKWAMAVLVRINGNLLGLKEKKKNSDFARWVDEFAPAVMDVIMRQLEVYRTSVYYYNKVTIRLFNFLKGVIDVSSLYKTIKANMDYLITSIFPRAMAITSDEIILWQEDPVQFVSQVYDVFYELTNVRNEAGDFLSYLSKVRANDILNPFLNYMMNSFDVYNNTDPSQRDYMSKEWMLYAFELLADNMLSKDSIKQNIEKVLRDYVLPEFQSPVGFLRARVCRLYAAFRKLEMRPEHLSMVTDLLLNCLSDAEFPVCISAAISLQSFLTNEVCMELIRPNVHHIVERFIVILQKVAVEEIVQSFESIISKYQKELLPLSANILSIVLAAFQDYKKDEENDTAMFTAMTTIDCVSTIVIAAAADPRFCDQVVANVIPVVMDIFVGMEVDFFDAALLIIRSCVYFYDNANTTRDLMWTCFPQLVLTVQRQAIDYIGSFFPVVDCYLCIESTDLLDRSYEGKSYLQLLLEFVNESLFDPELGMVEQGYALGVLMDIIHYYLNKLDMLLDPSLQTVFRFIHEKQKGLNELVNNSSKDADDEDMAEYYIDQGRHIIGRALMIVESCLIIKPVDTVTCLVRNGFAEEYLSLMDFADVHDSLLSARLFAMSIASLMKLPVSSLPSSFQNALPAFFNVFLVAMRDVETMRSEKNEEEVDDDYEDLMERLQGQNFRKNDWGYDEELDVDDEEMDPMDLSKLEHMGEVDGDFSEIDNDLINDVTIINEVAFVQDAFNNLNQYQPDIMKGLLSAAGPEASEFFEKIMCTPIN